ncbi:hypothetical protein ON010_g18094 [Phytophthora cinnamomi]|nr:hypothetical protein ON010_g18094 [Phytophthora cinnamomi]
MSTTKLKTAIATEAREWSGVVDYYSARTTFLLVVRVGFRTPSPCPEHLPSGRSVVPTCRVGEGNLSSECENNPDLGLFSYDQQFAGRSSEFLRVRLAAVAEVVETRPDGQRRVDPHLVLLHDQVTVVEYLQSAEVATLYLCVPAVAVSQTALNVPVGL